MEQMLEAIIKYDTVNTTDANLGALRDVSAAQLLKMLKSVALFKCYSYTYMRTCSGIYNTEFFFTALPLYLGDASLQEHARPLLVDG